METYKIACVLTGVRPIMFDRYPGNNDMKLPPEQKLYLGEDGALVVPAINVYSLLGSENTKSVAKIYYGKKWRDIALAINGYLDIAPWDIPLCDDAGPIKFDGTFNDQVKVHRSVARMKNGIPNPKVRPMVELPWHLELTLTVSKKDQLPEPQLRSLFDEAGTLGLGTYRPFFGKFVVGGWDKSE